MSDLPRQIKSEEQEAGSMTSSHASSKWLSEYLSFSSTPAWAFDDTKHTTDDGRPRQDIFTDDYRNLRKKYSDDPPKKSNEDAPKGDPLKPGPIKPRFGEPGPVHQPDAFSLSDTSKPQHTKEKYVDPFVRPIYDALCRGDTEEAKGQAKSILDQAAFRYGEKQAKADLDYIKTKYGEDSQTYQRAQVDFKELAKKYGKESTNYISALYKVASTFDPLNDLSADKNPYENLRETAAPYWQELINTTKKMYGSEADINAAVGDAYFKLGRNALFKNNLDDEIKYFEPATRIYENALKITLGSGLPPNLNMLDQLMSSYNSLWLVYRERGQDERVKQMDEKMGVLATSSTKAQEKVMDRQNKERHFTKIKTNDYSIP